jgi:NAD(P)-dependent dehydrogenase (short-subunit alcohol dehydrogenase family)
MDNLFEGKRAFVTGGGSGIGRACALALAAEGCFVTVAGRTESTLNDTVRSIVELGESAQAVTCDVTIESMGQSAVAAAAGDGGRLDVAVNSAGYDGSAAMPTSEWTGENVGRDAHLERARHIPSDEVVVWVASEKASYVTRVALPVDGGYAAA